MNSIRPVSDLKDNLSDISEFVHKTSQPVFLTSEGYGDMVVMSFEAFEKMQFENEVITKLAEAEKQAEETDRRFSSDDVLNTLKEAIRNV